MKHLSFITILLVISICNFSCKTADKNLPPNTLTAEQKKEGWKLLFDGVTTNGWHTYNQSTIGSAWKVQDGALHLDASKKGDWQTINGGDIIYDKAYSNFHFKVDWKIAPAGNSGVIFYAQEGAQYQYCWETGMESQVLDNVAGDDAKTPNCKAGDIYELVACSKDVVKPAGEWNRLEIICNNGKLNLIMNGTKVIDIMLWDEHWQKLIAGSKFASMPGFGMFRTGKFALQDHGHDVWFRNIMVKEL
ncbi:MAG: DUF1080 domain-containing protein [Chitinophagaceae bacterium]|jgi:uncharacterized protein YaiE (UPF0345 family)|nr:DUF1080 domain-containing protein [Chitinophagaceae bacterium]